MGDSTFSDVVYLRVKDIPTTPSTDGNSARLVEFGADTYRAHVNGENLSHVTVKPIAGTDKVKLPRDRSVRYCFYYYITLFRRK